MLHGISLARGFNSANFLASKNLASKSFYSYILHRPFQTARCLHVPSISRQNPSSQIAAGSVLSGHTSLDETAGDESTVSSGQKLIGQVLSLFAETDDLSTTCNRLRESQGLMHHFADRGKVVRLIQLLAVEHPLLAYRVLTVAKAIGCRIKINAYECAAYQLAIQKYWSPVLSIVSLAEEHDLKLSVRLLNWRLRAYAETQQFSAIPSALAEFARHGRVPNMQSYHALIAAHLSNHNLAQTVHVLHQMAEAGFVPDSSTYALMASNYRPLGRNTDVQNHAISTLDDVQPSRATVALNSLVQHQLDAGDIEAAMKLLSHFRPEFVAPIVSAMLLLHGTSLMSPSRGSFATIAPNVRTFTLFLHHLAVERRLDAVVHLLQEMDTLGIPTDRDAVSALVRVHFEVGSAPAGISIVARLCRRESLHLLSPFYSEDDDPKLPALPADLKPNIKIFNALFRGLLATHGLGSSPQVIQLMHNHEVYPDSTTLGILLTHLNRVEHAQPQVLLRVLRALSSTAIIPMLRHFHVIMSAILRQEKKLLFGSGWNATSARFSRRRNFQSPTPSGDRITGDSVAFDPLAGVDLPQVPKLRALGSPLIQELSYRGVLSDSPTIGLRIQRDAEMRSDFASAREIFGELVARGLRPNAYHFSALMSGYVRSGNVQGAIEIMSSAMQSGVQPNVVMFTMIIVGYARHGKPDMAIQTFQEMLSAQIPPDVPAIDAVASAFFSIGAYATARQTLITLWPYIQPFPEEYRDLPLKELAIRFRSLHGTDPGRLSQQNKIKLYRMLQSVKRNWRKVA